MAGIWRVVEAMTRDHRTGEEKDLENAGSHRDAPENPGTFAES